MVTVVSALLVRDRSTRVIDRLNMSCDEREIPASPTVGDSPEYWLSANAAFSGVVHLLDDDGGLTPGHEVGASSMTAALAIGQRHLIALASPNDVSVPAVWLSHGIEGLEISTDGTHGVFKKKPRAIIVTSKTWELVLRYVNSFDRERNCRKPGREAALAAALDARG